MKKYIKIKSFSKPHLWYADKIGKVFELESDTQECFLVNKLLPNFVIKEDAEIVQVGKIRITDYRGYVKGDEIFTEDSVHYVVEPPKGYEKDERGYWVKGAFEERPILILHGEYVIEEYNAI